MKIKTITLHDPDYLEPLAVWNEETEGSMTSVLNRIIRRFTIGIPMDDYEKIEIRIIIE